MKRFLVGIFCGFLLAALVAVIVVFAAIRFSSRPPSLADGSTLVMRLDGSLPEIAPAEIPIPALETRAPMTLMEVWDTLRKAAVDKRIKAIALEPNGIDAGWAKLSEVRDGILKFKKASGKPVIAYLRSPNARDYYIATAADKVYMSREDILDLKGMRVEMQFFKRGLDKLGVELEVEHAGKYKDAADSFIRTSATPETREVMDAMLDQLYGDLVSSIAARVTAEKRTPEQVRAMLDDGPFLAPQALQLGLIDGLLYQGDYEDELKKKLGQKELTKFSARDYSSISAESLGLESGSKIAVVMGQGDIVRGNGPAGLGASGDNLFSASFNALLRRVGDDDSIRGVILRIDSPGGDAIASDEMLEEVKRLSKKKPMVVAMSDVAASGGYYMAMSGDPVLAYPNTITGSIGVIFGKVNLSGLFDKLGIDTEIIKRGKFADIDTSAHALTPEGREKLRAGIDHTYRSFLARVAEGRKRPVTQIEPLAQGRVWMGTQAKQQGLLDELGGIDRSIELVKQRAKISSGDKVRLVLYPQKQTAMELLFGSSNELLQSGSEAAIHARIERELSQQLKTVAPGISWRVLSPGGMLQIMPYGISIH